MCHWGCPAAVYHWRVLPWGYETALMHAYNYYLELGVWCPWVGQDSCEKWVCLLSSKCYTTHLTIFPGAYASQDPNVPNF